MLCVYVFRYVGERIISKYRDLINAQKLFNEIVMVITIRKLRVKNSTNYNHVVVLAEPFVIIFVFED